MTELFIYYRVREPDAALALSAVRTMQAGLHAEFPDVTARLLRRPEPDANGLQTWMETYASASSEADLDATLRARIEVSARALAPWIVGERHTEVFVACAW